MNPIQLLVAAAACAAAVSTAQAASIRYSGFLMTDVSFAGTVYQGAQVWLRFDSDTRYAAPYSDQTGQGFKNPHGRASVRIVSGTTTLTASINPDQIYVYFDQAHASAGFGSFAGGNGYPLALGSPSFDGAETLSSSLVGAVASIANNASNKANYTPPTATLSLDLHSPTVLAGMASSCSSASFDPVNVTCPSAAIAAPLALGTSRGELIVYEPYTATYPVGSNFVYAANWGMFWSEMLDD